MFVFIFSFSGCGKKKENKQAEKEEMNVKVEKSGQKVKVKSDQGEGYIEVNEKKEVALPKDWPEDIKIYKNEKVFAVSKMPQGEQVMIKTKDSMKEIEKWYRADLVQKAWKEKLSMDMGGTWTGMYEKDGKRLNITIVPDEKDKEINLINLIYSKITE